MHLFFFFFLVVIVELLTWYSIMTECIFWFELIRGIDTSISVDISQTWNITIRRFPLAHIFLSRSGKLNRLVLFRVFVYKEIIPSIDKFFVTGIFVIGSSDSVNSGISIFNVNVFLILRGSSVGGNIRCEGAFIAVLFIINFVSHLISELRPRLT